jgi:hypothetical protein
MTKKERIRNCIKEKAKEKVIKAKLYARQHGKASKLAKGLIELDPKKQKDAFERFNGITYVSK